MYLKELPTLTFISAGIAQRPSAVGVLIVQFVIPWN